MKRKKLTCKFCGHVWLSRINPKYCPDCHNDWRQGRKRKIKRDNRKVTEKVS